MPYHLEYEGKDRAFVVSTDTGKRHSRHAMPVKRAEAQKRVLEQAMVDAGEPAAHRRGRGRS